MRGQSRLMPFYVAFFTSGSQDLIMIEHVPDEVVVMARNKKKRSAKPPDM